MIVLKSQDEIDRMAVACRIVAEVLMKIRESIVPGMTTKELDQIAESYILSQKATPAFKGYKGYPATLCTSLNDQVVHGIPGPAVLKEGDIISIDVGVYQGGFYGDAAITLPVGQISEEAGKLLSATEEALYKGIEKALVGNRLSDISYAVQKHAEADGFSVVKQFVGHGIGRELHEDPQIPNFGKPGVGPILRDGMTLAIEPMINAGTWKVDVMNDGWTAVTRDHRLSAHFEHTVAVTKNGPLILTKFH
ncbi:MAG: type I methionyl aminopeptidase [Thermodesulfovibrionia bacterium]|nr:type I methionyl aminopeptidase [Thermodesulfovibrionia bacterium]